MKMILKLQLLPLPLKARPQPQELRRLQAVAAAHQHRAAVSHRHQVMAAERHHQEMVEELPIQEALAHLKHPQPEQFQVDQVGLIRLPVQHQACRLAGACLVRSRSRSRQLIHQVRAHVPT